MDESLYEQDLQHTAHRPYPLPDGKWLLRQRWNNLLFAHWPIPIMQMQALLPASLEVDSFDGYAWAGVVPFVMDQVRSRFVGSRAITFPGTERFEELNLRTYVRSRKTGLRGVFFFALDCSSPLSVLGARTLFHLPYFPARMSAVSAGEEIEYKSRRLLTRSEVQFDASYHALGAPAPASEPGSLEEFLTEQYRLFTPFAGRLYAGNIHHLAWPLQPAEAEFRRNDLPAAHGLTLPDRAPVLHFARELRVTLWGLHPE